MKCAFVRSHLAATSASSIGFSTLTLIQHSKSSFVEAFTFVADATVLTWIFIAICAILPSIASDAIAKRLIAPSLTFYVLWNCVLFATYYLLLNCVRMYIGIGVPDEPIGHKSGINLWPIACFCAGGAIYGFTYFLMNKRTNAAH